MLSQDETFSAEEELTENLPVASTSSAKGNENIQLSLPSYVTENPIVPNGNFHPHREPSSSNASSKIMEPAATSVTAIKTSVICSSHLLNRNVPPKQSVQNSVPLRNSHDSHEQGAVENVSLKYSHDHLEESDNEPEPEFKMVCLRPSNSPILSYCYEENDIQCFSNIRFPRQFTITQTNCTKRKRISTETNSSITYSHSNSKSITPGNVDSGSTSGENTESSSRNSANSPVPKMRLLDGVINYISSYKVPDNLNSEFQLGLQSSDDETSDSSLFDKSSKCHDNPDEKYFDHLPFGITEQILCRLPLLDLMRCRSVCKSWNRIISNRKYLVWKKVYCDMKYGCISTRWIKALEIFRKQEEDMSVENCFRALISFMSKSFLRKPPNDLAEFLHHIPSCVTAEALLLERFSNKPLLCTHPWCILTVTVLLSSTIEDLYKVFNYLINVCLCDYEDMTEFMFCIATFLLYFMRTYSINHGIHYRLYNVIYMFENGFVAETNIPSIRDLQERKEYFFKRKIEEPAREMTYEQMRILNHELAPDQRVKIISHAGAGKTTTLAEFAKRRPDLNFLYISLREVAGDDMLLFPSNVVCKTANSLAYEAIGKYYMNKLSMKLKPFDILPFVHRWDVFSKCRFSYGKCILLTIENYARSADEFLSIAHVPKCSCSPAFKVKLTLFNQSEPFDNGDLLRLLLLNESTELWEKMISVHNEVKVTQDICLKLFYLTKPNFEEYDCLMVDEMEDCNAGMLAVILSQKMPVILAGDPNQQINELRGTISPWKKLGATHVYSLTKSFRFGPDIAYVGSCCLEIFQHKTPTLVGNTKPSNIDGMIIGQYAIITRTSETLFLEAARMCCTTVRKPHEPIYFRGAFVGGMSIYGFEQLADIHRLKTEDTACNVRDPFIKEFYNYSFLKQYAALADDKNMAARLNLVEEHGDKIIEYITSIKRACSYELGEADVVFGTAQNVKGFEFDTVGLTNDYQLGTVVTQFNYRVHHFEPYHVNPTEGHLMEAEEQNLIYVALTRAKKCLVMSEKLYSVLLEAQEKFEYPVVSSTIPCHSISLKCASCSKSFIPHTFLTMVRKSLIMKSGRKPWSGPLCVSCATNPTFMGSALLNPEPDHAHASMVDFVGPLSIEDPIVHDEPYRYSFSDDGT